MSRVHKFIHVLSFLPSQHGPKVAMAFFTKQVLIGALHFRGPDYDFAYIKMVNFANYEKINLCSPLT